MASLCRATGVLDSWRALIGDSISALFLKSGNNESAASKDAYFTISPFQCSVANFHSEK